MGANAISCGQRGETAVDLATALPDAGMVRCLIGLKRKYAHRARHLQKYLRLNSAGGPRQQTTAAIDPSLHMGGTIRPGVCEAEWEDLWLEREKAERTRYLATAHAHSKNPKLVTEEIISRLDGQIHLSRLQGEADMSLRREEERRGALREGEQAWQVVTTRKGSNSSFRKTSFLNRRAPWGSLCELENDDSLKAGCVMGESDAERAAEKIGHVMRMTVDSGAPNKVLRDMYGSSGAQTRNPKFVVPYEQRGLWKGPGLPVPAGRRVPTTEASHGIRRFREL